MTWKIIEAMHNDATQETESDTYLIDRISCVKDLASHWAHEKTKNVQIGREHAYMNQEMSLFDEFYEMDSRDLEIEYFDTFDVKVVIE